MIVNYRTIKEKAIILKKELLISDLEFKVSNTWIFKFCRRHQIGSRSMTHHGQVSLFPSLMGYEFDEKLLNFS